MPGDAWRERPAAFIYRALQRLLYFVLAARPKTLPAALVPLAVGTGVASASGPPDWVSVVLGTLTLLLLQILSNFANDLGDALKGADTTHRAGPARMVQRGHLSVAAMQRAILAVALLALAGGSWLAVREGAWVVGAGLVGLAAALGYTLGRRPLAYRGLGDITVFLLLGPVAVAGATALSWPALASRGAYAGVAVGALAAALLMVNNIRDAAGDAQAGKRTLVVRFGRRWGEAGYIGWLMLAYAVVGVGAGRAIFPLHSAATFVLAPLAVYIAWRLLRSEGSALNAVLELTALHLLLFGGTFAASLFLT